MAMQVKAFGQVADRLSRNPIGVIALFIVLVYGIAALIVGTTQLTPDERRPLIYFLVFFPPMVLLAFYRLVSSHHTKLYAPRDYHDGEGFFRALTPDEQRKRLEEEVKEVEKIEKQDPPPAGPAQSPPVRPAQASYFLAETLVFRELESELKRPITRHVALGPDAGVDGMFVRDGSPVFIEVKLVRRRISAALRNQVVEIAARVLNPSFPQASMMFVFVTEGLAPGEREELLVEMSRILNEREIPAQVRVIDFAELVAKYGLGELASNMALNATVGRGRPPAR